MTDCTYLLDAEAWMDGESGDRADEIAKHLALCPICKAHIESQRRFDFAVREAAATVHAPASLFESLNDLDAAAPKTDATPVTRRALFGRFAVAASIAAIGSAALLRRTDLVNNMPMAVLGDFATHLDADRKLDLIETNPSKVMAWFTPKLPFSLPELSLLSDLELIGGRLCWLLDRRIAAFNFDHDGKAVGLYVTDEADLTDQNGDSLPRTNAPPAIISLYGLNGAFWRDGELAHALVGQSSSEAIGYFAKQLY